jgi:uncharacterized protein
VKTRVAVYAMLGGVPAYWEQFDPQRSVSENIRTELLNYSASMHDDLERMERFSLVGRAL